MALNITFPQGRTHALVLSYDDGNIADRRLVEIFNKYGLKGTFHLNSGIIGAANAGNHVRPEELTTLYAGHEIAGHTVNHPFLETLPQSEVLRQFWEDRRQLEAWTQRIVSGMSYPNGSCSPDIMTAARTAGVEYSRTTVATERFSWPSDPLAWHPSCHHHKALELVDKFLHGYGTLKLFYVWGHSHEFERNHNWELMEEFARQISGRSEIWYATNIEIARYIKAVRSLVISADAHQVYNPAAASVWLRVQNELVTVASGETKNI